MIIYKTTNLVNGKIYIGKDTKNDSTYLGSGMLLHKAIQKYGLDFFNKEILEECNDQILLAEQEKYWIAKFNATDRKVGYNITDGGFGGDTFTNNPNKEIIRGRHKIATSTRNEIYGGWSPNPLKRIEMAKNANAARTEKGYSHSQETRDKIGIAHKDKVVSKETRDLISIKTKEAMSKIDQTELQAKALEGRKKSWKARDRQRIDKIKELLIQNIKSGQINKELGISSPTYYRLLKIAKEELK
jgi:group I intron endonuclease